MRNLKLRQQITFTITLFILCFLLSSSNSNAQFSNNPYQNGCNIHSNFKDMVKHLEADSRNYYNVQVTIINPGRNGGKTHRYTAWNSTITLRSKNICKGGIRLPKTKIYFSSRGHFDKKRADIQTFNFDVVRNSVDVILNSWDDTKIPIYNLVKKGRLIYGVDQYGKMVVFNFKEGVILL